MKKLFFVGIDISKRTFDVSYHNGSKPVYLGYFPNTEMGFKAMIAALKKVTKHRKPGWFLCFENTGVYSKPLFSFLSLHNYPCREEMPLHLSRSLGVKRGKTDEIDSLDICQYAFEKRDSIEASQPLSDQMTRLRKALSYRDLIVRKRVSFELSLKDQKAGLDEDFYELLNAENEKLIAHCNELIKKIDALIESIIAEDESSAFNHELAQSVIGIGPVISAFIIAYSNNYECFGDARAFCCYCAIAPFPFESGTSIKKKNRTSYMGHKKLKALLSNGASAAIRFDNEIKAYFDRKIGEGKAEGIVRNNVKNKLIHRVFAVIKRQTPYVALKRHMRKEVIHN